MTTLQIFDLIALAALWWIAASYLVAGHEVRTWRGAALAAALIAVLAFSFVGAIATIKGFYVFKWWVTRGLTYSLAAVAIWLYDYRFGVIRHVRMAGAGIANKGRRLIGMVSRARNFRKDKSA